MKSWKQFVHFANRSLCMKSRLFYIVAILGLALAACEDLPKPTYLGKQTFGCYVDGKRWTPKGRLLQFGDPIPPVRTSFYPINDVEYLTVYAYLGNQSLEFSLSGSPLSTKTFQLNSSTHSSSGYCAAFNLDEEGSNTTQIQYSTDSLHTGKVTITRLDRAAKIISGTFSFTGYHAQTGKTVQVTEGRFDLNY